MSREIKLEPIKSIITCGLCLNLLNETTTISECLHKCKEPHQDCIITFNTYHRAELYIIYINIRIIKRKFHFQFAKTALTSTWMQVFAARRVMLLLTK